MTGMRWGLFGVAALLLGGVVGCSSDDSDGGAGALCAQMVRRRWPTVWPM